VATPSGCFKSTPTLRRPRANKSGDGGDGVCDGDGACVGDGGGDVCDGDGACVGDGVGDGDGACDGDGGGGDDGVGDAAPRTKAARSKRNTSAPISANNMAQNGPGPIPAISNTLMPVRGPDIMDNSAVSARDKITRHDRDAKHRRDDGVGGGGDSVHSTSPWKMWSR